MCVNQRVYVGAHAHTAFHENTLLDFETVKKLLKIE